MGFVCLSTTRLYMSTWVPNIFNSVTVLTHGSVVSISNHSPGVNKGKVLVQQTSVFTNLDVSVVKQLI